MDLLVLYGAVVALALWHLISEVIIWRAFKRRDEDLAAVDDEVIRTERRVEGLHKKMRIIVGALKRKGWR